MSNMTDAGAPGPLGKLADFTMKRHRAVLAAWVLAFALAVPLAPQIEEAVVYEEQELMPDDLESQEASRRMAQRFGGDAAEGSLVVVLVGDGIERPAARDAVFRLTDALQNAAPQARSGHRVRVDSVYTAAAAFVAGALREQAGGAGDFTAQARAIVRNSTLDTLPAPLPASVVSAFINVPRNDTMLVQLTFLDAEGRAERSSESVEAVRAAVRSAVSGSGLRAFVTGQDAVVMDAQLSMERDMELIDPLVVVLMVVLIGAFFRSFLASAVPPLIIGLSVVVGFGLVALAGSNGLPLDSAVPVMMLTAMMGAGCDYCIFILSRYREERAAGNPKERSLRTALEWAGESIATSGATVILGFGVLALARNAALRSMGLALALGVGVALLAALTFLPAAVMALGDRTFWPARLDRPRPAGRFAYFSKSAGFSMRHPRTIVAVALLVSVPAAWCAFTMETSFDSIGTMPRTESKEGLEAMTGGFGAGRIMPTYVLVETDRPVFSGGRFDTGLLAEIENLSARLASLSGVKLVLGPTRPLGGPVDFANLTALPPGVAAQYVGAMLQFLGGGNRTALLTVNLVEQPFTRSSLDAIPRIREIGHAAAGGPGGISSVLVGGASAEMHDLASDIGGDFSFIRAVLIVGIYVVLLVVLRSALNPLRMVVTILMSVGWTLALTSVLFQAFFGTPVIWMVALILFVVCLGLGMDYDILLTTRIMEEARRGRPREEAIRTALERTGAVITACGVVMAFGFGTMMLSSGALLKQFGFSLFVAILLDALLVRTYLVPAMLSLGKWEWWVPRGVVRGNGGVSKPISTG